METFTGWMVYYPDDLASAPRPLDSMPLGAYPFTRAIRNDEGGFAIDWREWEETGGIVVSSADGVMYTGRYDYLNSGAKGDVHLQLYQGREVRIILFGRWVERNESRFWLFQLNPVPLHAPEPVTASPRPKRKTTAKPKRESVAKPKTKTTVKAKPKTTVKAKPKTVAKTTLKATTRTKLKTTGTTKAKSKRR